MKYLLLCTLIVSACLCQDTFTGLSLEERCERLGYQYEEHTVTTEDGYILTIHRVPGLIGEDISEKPPMFMSRSLLISYTGFFVGDTDAAPGYYLARNGYDVWSMSIRGTQWSSQHEEYTIDDEEFWDFTASDFRIDFRAAIDYILEETDFPQVYAYGQSTGLQILVFAFALEPEYFGERVRLLHSVTPVTNLANTQSPFFITISSYPVLFDMVRMSGNGRMGGANPFGRLIIQLFCGQFRPLCDMGEVLLLNDVQITNRNSFSDAMSPAVDDISADAFQQVCQSARTGEVAELDYGAARNMEIYGQRTPPLIPIRDIEVPVMIYQGELDMTADIEDSQWFADELSRDSFLGMNVYDMDHLAFGMGNNMAEFLEDIVEISNENPIVRSDER